MKKLSILFVLTLLVSGCVKERFHITGHVAGGEGKMLYFEAMELTRTTLLDSLRLPADGAFAFAAPTTEYPEFYRLRLEGSYIHLAVDSTETINVEVARLPIAADYSVTGSAESEKIRVIAEAGNRLKSAYDVATRRVANTPAERAQKAETLQKEIDLYKAKVSPYIYENPASQAAYFAIFQRVNGLDVFDRTNRKDSRAVLAVANAYHSFMPESPRSKHLYDVGVAILQHDRAARMAQNDTVPAAKEVSLIDIVLPDQYGKKHSLHELKGKVVLLDFTAYTAEGAPDYNRALVALHDRYHSEGFEIYQVSVDTDENQWQVSADNLPWVCVRGSESENIRALRSYNVQNLPTAFLIDRDGVLQQRVAAMKNLPRDIEKLLKQKK